MIHPEGGGIVIKNVIFDMGKVLIDFNPAIYVRRLGYTGQDAELLETEIFKTAEWCATDRGTLLPAEAAEIFKGRVPTRLQAAVEPLVCHWFEGALIPIEGMAKLVGELKSRGYGIYLLSNASRDIYKYFNRIPGSEFFDGMLVSADWLLAKPQHEIYEKLYSQFSLNPEECLFIDDLPANIEAAQTTGMKGIVFRGDISRLRRELCAAGIKVEP